MQDGDGAFALAISWGHEDIAMQLFGMGFSVNETNHVILSVEKFVNNMKVLRMALLHFIGRVSVDSQKLLKF